MESQTCFPKITIGLDLGDRKSCVCELDASGRVLRRGTIATTEAAIRAYLGGRERSRVVLEAGTHSPWISRQLEGLGHEVVVANPALVYGGRRRKKRNDQMDAEFLARQGRADVKLLHPIQHRTAESQRHLETIRARDQLVGARSKLISHVRGAVKAQGARIVKCSAECFPRKAAERIPQDLLPALEPLLTTIAELSRAIHKMDKQVEKLALQYPAVSRLRQITGVGPLTALAFVLLIEDPKRFTRSRDVGAYFGLVPRLDESSDSSPQLRITKAGDALGRRLLVSAAQYVLGPFGPECDLRRYGEAIAARGGKNAKKRAVVAVARKMAVLMHRLWVTNAEYEPNRTSSKRAA